MLYKGVSQSGQFGDEDTYWRITKLRGRNRPKKKKNDAKHKSANAGSRRGRMKSMRMNGLGEWLNLDFTVRLQITSIPRIIKAAALIVQGNPIRGMSFETMIGKITPPSDDPDAMTPNAAALFLKNQVPTEFMAAKKTILEPIGLHTPCDKKIW